MKLGTLGRGAMLVVALSVVMLQAAVALADTVTNNLDGTVDNTVEQLTLNAGASGSTLIFLRATDASSAYPDSDGCNATPSVPVTVSVASSNPSVATARLVNPSISVFAKTSFTGCTDFQPGGTTLQDQSQAIRVLVTVLSGAPAGGTAEITISGLSSNSRGTLYYGSATFRVTVPGGVDPCASVAVPAAPVFTTKGSDADGSNGWFVTIPTVSASSSTPDATISYSTNGTDFSAAAPTLSEGTTTVTAKATTATCNKTSTSSETFKIDLTAPDSPTASVSSPDYSDGAADWYKDSVTVSYLDNGDPDMADDSPGSGVASVTTPQTFSSAGAFVATGYATDHAGNQSTGTAVTGRVDTAAPDVSLSCPNAPVVLGTSSTASWTATDPGSPDEALGVVAGEEGGDITLDTSTVGTRFASVPAGTSHDRVGHESAEQSCQYAVVYGFSGFAKPVDTDGEPNRTKAGASVAVKFRLSGDQGLDVLSGPPTVTQVSCSTGLPSAEFETQAASTANNGLTYDADAGQYNFVWKTQREFAGECYRFALNLDDGTSHTALFQFFK